MNTRLLFVLGLAAALSADQLTLTSGVQITGSFLDGNARTIRFVSGDQIRTYSAADVRTIRFGDTDASQPPPIGNVLPAGLAITVKFEVPVDSRRDAVGTDYRGSLVSGLPVGPAPLIPPGSEVTLRLVKDDASGQINGRDVLTMAVVNVLVSGKRYDISTVRVKPSAPVSPKWVNALALQPISATGERVRVPAGIVLMFTLAESLTVDPPSF